jgi:nucleoside-diphosphate-sugar epimerase
MQKTLGFDEDNIHLTPVSLSTLHGFIFVNHSSRPPSLSESLGDMPEKLSEWFGPHGTAKDMVCVKRRTYNVACNWKFIYENTCETYHTSVVHRGSLGPMKSTPMEPHVGDWDGVRIPSERTIVPLPTDFEGVDKPLPAFTNKSCFINVFPSLQINVTWDCLWWMNTIPIDETTSRIEMGFCFPPETTRLPCFPTVLERYLHRWHVAVTEDNDISLNQQRGVRSVFRTPGRYGQLEFGTHNFNNWLLSKVLHKSGFLWNPGQRVFESTEELWSNDDRQMLNLADQAVASEKRLNVNTVAAKSCVVCVTGASGFIGLHVVKQLLERNYNVIATVRNIKDAEKMAPLLAMQSTATAMLRIVGGCEILSPGSFDEILSECEICFHVASPFWMDDRIQDPYKELIYPAEQGTLNVLHSCAKAAKMRRVVVTSSFGAIMNVGGRNPYPMDFHYSEDFWNSSSAPVDGVFPEPRNVHAYRWSKTVAERAAWDFVASEKPRFDITCICPPMVLGPNLQKLSSKKDLNQSSLILYRMISGEMQYAMPGSVGFVDVRDVAKAHILAAETPAAASQRYLCSGITQTWLSVAHLMQKIFPGKPIPTSCEDGRAEQPCMNLDNSKICGDLGIEFMPLEETLRDQCQSFFEAALF